MIFQHFNLLNSKSVYKNVAMPLILSKTNKKEIKKVDEMLEFVGLADKKINFQMNYQVDKNNVLPSQEH